MCACARVRLLLSSWSLVSVLFGWFWFGLFLVFLHWLISLFVAACGLVWLGLAWLGLAGLGLGLAWLVAWLGLAWLGLAWLDLAWLGLAWLDLTDGVSDVTRLDLVGP